jgi:thioredoxin-like negative regulator of GroEL
MNIHSIPTLVIFDEGEEIRRFIGLQKADSLTKAMESTSVSP